MGCVLFFAIIDIVAKVAAYTNSLPSLYTPYVHLAYFANPGIAFSIPLPQTFTLFITGTLIILLGALLINTHKAQIQIALFCALLGATSNFFDRLITKHTTDYLILFSRSAINIADILILAGIGYCAWYYQKADIKKQVE